MKKFKLLFLFVPIVFAVDWHQEVFYHEINQFRKDPLLYQKNHTDLVVRCTVPLDETYPPLQVVSILQESSSFQASTMASNECFVITHDTCPNYCWHFGTCSFQDRMDTFLRNTRHHNPLEIMIKGVKDPYKIFYQFLNSEPHCNHILNCHINSMGASFIRIDKNIFVADFVYISPNQDPLFL